MKWTDLQIGDELEFTIEYLIFLKDHGFNIELYKKYIFEIVNIFYEEFLRIGCIYQSEDGMKSLTVDIDYDGNYLYVNNSLQMFNIVSLKEN